MKLFRFIVVVMITWMYVVQADRSIKYRARRNIKVPELYVEKRHVTNDVTMCVVLCTSEETFQCDSASWSDGICLLTRVEMIHEVGVMEIKEGWTTMCRIVYPVFLAVGDGGQYSMTFVDALLRCAERGSIIATRQDMLDARAMGFEICVCGWLSDGTIGFVMQEPTTCWGQWNEGIIGGCSANNPKADVYCIA